MSTQALICPRHEDRQVELRLQSLHTDSGRPGQLIELWECPECGYQRRVQAGSEAEVSAEPVVEEVA